VKRKAAKRKTAKVLPSLPAKPLEYDPNKFFYATHDDIRPANGRWKPVQKSEIAGISLPANLDAIAELIGREHAEWYRESHPFPAIALPDHQADFLCKEIASAVRQGFVLAVLRYADDLKHVPEALAMLEANRRNSARGGVARSKQADPRRREARRLDRELRKTVKKKYLRVQRIATEMRCSEKTVERYLSKQK
jgi:hypothetical protein